VQFLFFYEKAVNQMTIFQIDVTLSERFLDLKGEVQRWIRTNKSCSGSWQRWSLPSVWSRL
jgi:hypothetical protein